jgi:phosphatidylinositol alpha-1,6-mannosyltransferase
MKIAIFSFDIDRTYGTGNIAYELCMELYHQGVNFELFLPKIDNRDNKLNIEKCVGFPFPVNCIMPEYVSGIGEMVRKKLVLQYLKKYNLKGFSLVHCLFEFPHSFIAARSAQKNKLPFIMGAQGTYGVLPLTKSSRPFLKWSYKQAQEIIVPSQFTKEMINKYANENYNISIIHNGVNFSRFEKQPDISKLQKKYANKKIILTVGGLIPRKGQDMVIQALPKIKEKHPDVKYLLAGSGRMLEDWQLLAKKLDLENYVEFLGKIKADEVNKWFYLCDIYVHTPIVANLSFEGFGIVYIEASACGKPIVASDAGGIRDAVVDNQTGLIAKDRDVDDIANKIIQLLDNQNLREQMGHAGRQYAKEHDWTIITEQFIEKYKKYSL